MKTLSTAVFIAIAGLVSMPVLALADTDYTVHGRDDFVLETALRDQGTPVDSVEEWGAYVRAWTVDANGHSAMVLFDPDTLQPLLN